jgi:hypothetical protein
MRRLNVIAFLTMCFTVLTSYGIGQIISSETIKKDVISFMTDSSSVDYYDKLKIIFETDESKLTEHQFYLLYYGQSSKPEKLYPSLLLNADRRQLNNLVSRNKFKKAIPPERV